METSFQPSLQNILDQSTLRWIFVGGKGGVGKTTVSSSLSIQLAQIKKKVLIISTDPAHNLSDSFNQQLGANPIQIKGIDNLYGCEIDPKSHSESSADKLNDILGYSPDSNTMGIFNDLTTSIPGIDEAMSLGYIMKIVKEQDFDCVVFDTAPTGHTLRLLNFPNILEKGLEKMLTFKEKMGSMVQSLGMLGGGNFDQAFEKMFYSLDSLKANIENVNTQFKDDTLTTFIAVCIPEFLSMYETERLTQDLITYKINIRNIVINQVLITEDNNCQMCCSRKKMQAKYINQINDLFEDFHITVLPLMNEEVRGVNNLSEFSKLLLKK